MKKNPTYRSKAESLETRAQLDNQPIPTTVLEQIFFSLDGIQARESTHKNTNFDNRHSKKDPPRHQTHHRNNLLKRSYSANKATIATIRSKQGQISKTYKFCVYCYKKGHDDNTCPDKKSGKPPSKPEWTNNIRCHICNQIGHLAFDCPPKYKCAVARTTITNQNQKHSIFKTSSPSTSSTKTAPILKTPSTTSSSEPHLAGSATVHFAHAATVAYHQQIGTTLYQSFYKIQK